MTQAFLLQWDTLAIYMELDVLSGIELYLYTWHPPFSEVCSSSFSCPYLILATMTTLFYEAAEFKLATVTTFVLN